MLESKNQSLEDQIIKLLASREGETTELQEELKKIGIRATVQGIYRVIRKLLSNGVLVKIDKKVTVSREWAERVSKIFGNKSFISDIAEGDSLVYTFSNLNSLDSYWKHLMVFVEAEKKDSLNLLYVTHSFWRYFAHPGSEENYYRSFAERKDRAYLLIAGKTIFDRESKKYFENPYVQIHCGEFLMKNYYDHTAIYGDFIIETKFKRSTAEKIEEIYNTSKTEEELEEKIVELLSKKQTFKIVLERNKKRAEELKKKFEKFFILK